MKNWKTKAEMNCFKPGDLLVREKDHDIIENSSSINNSSEGVSELSID